MGNNKEIAHYIVAGLDKAQFIASRNAHGIFTERKGAMYFKALCQTQENADRAIFDSGGMLKEVYEERQEEREKALEVLSTSEHVIPYYLLIHTKDNALASAFKAATPDLLQTFAPLVRAIYKAQYKSHFMTSDRSSVSKDSLEYILEASRSSQRAQYDIGISIVEIMADLTPRQQEAILDTALFCLLEHRYEMLTPKQRAVIHSRKEAHEKRIEKNPQEKNHFEILGIHLKYACLEEGDLYRLGKTSSEALAECKAELETQINEMAAQAEGRQADPTEIRTPEEEAEIQVAELERMRGVAENLPQETEEEKKAQEDILHRINALCVLADPNRTSIYRFLIKQSPELREIFIDASPELIDKTINGLCAFARLNEKMQESGLDSIQDIDQEIIREYGSNAQYGSNDAEIREAKTDFALHVLRHNSEPLHNMVLCSTLVELYKDQDSGLTRKQRRGIERKVSFHNQKPRNEPQQEQHSHYDRLKLTTQKGHDIGNLVKPGYQAAENDMPPPLNDTEIFQEVWERARANTDRNQRGVKHNFQVHHEMQNEYNNLRGARVLCRDTKMQLLYNTALDHSERDIRERVRNLSEEEARILKQAFFGEPLSYRRSFTIEVRTEEERELKIAKLNLLNDPDRRKWEPEITRLFESSGLMKQGQDTSWFTYIIRILSEFIQKIKHAIAELFFPEPVQERGYYAKLDRTKYYGEEIPEPQPQIPTQDAGKKSEPENPHDPQSEIGATNRTGVAPQQNTHQSH